jgi:putative FmdB family regulatory protein
MPIHEYKCTACGAVNDLLIGIGRNSDEIRCRVCGGADLERIMSASFISVRDQQARPPSASTCCGSNPSETGCTPGSCCGSA